MRESNIYKMKKPIEKIPDNIENLLNHEWIKSGINILHEQGFRAISKASICQEIKKTEQDFDVIFNGLDSYLFSVLDYWYEKETLAYIDIMDDVAGNAEQAILTLVEVLHNADKRDELAIRSWALKYPDARKALDKVDRTRMDVGIGLFREMGFSEQESVMRSKILYTSTIGTEYTSVSSSLDQKIAMCKLLMEQN